MSGVAAESGVAVEPTKNLPAQAKKLSASEKRRQRAKQKQAERRAEREARARTAEAGPPEPTTAADDVEYVSAPREYEDLLDGAGADIKEEQPASADVGMADADGGSPGATPGLGSTVGLGGGGLGLGATPSGASDWDGLGATPGLGDTPGLGAGGEPDATPANGGIGFTKSASEPQKAGDAYAEFERIFNRFASAEEVTGAKRPEADATAMEDDAADDTAAAVPESQAAAPAATSDADSDGEDAQAKSKKKRKLEARLKIAELKQSCARPDVVEVWDVTAQDPKLLVYLKAYRNSVPVPRHWSQKRKYLQGKRGIEKPPFKLPDFIDATGIGEMRQAYHEKEENKKLKSKQRERMQPKMGKLDIDYQVLHDAFFKFQTKPQLTVMGDLYYEGKEFEARVKASRPGILSSDLRAALGMGDTTPPPWLINMQRYGPPPSYPDLKVAGLNAPIPPGAQFGYQPGGWGKPPVDEIGEPLYGDVFGQYAADSDDEHVDKSTHWGDLESEDEASSEEEEQDEEGVEVDTESLADGLTSVVSGLSSLPSGIETPEVLDLRKAKAGGEKPLYQVLEQQPAQLQAGQLMGTDHTYVMPPGGDVGTRRAANTKKLEALRRESGADMEVAINPEELEGLDDAAIRALYEQRLEEERARHSREDFSEMVAQKAAQQKRKAAAKESSKTKKQKEKDSFQF